MLHLVAITMVTDFPLYRHMNGVKAQFQYLANNDRLKLSLHFSLQVSLTMTVAHLLPH